MKVEVQGYDEIKRAIRTMCEALAGLPDSVIFDSKLVAMELLSNVVQHGGGRATFSYEVQGSELRMTVRGEREFRPPDRSVLADVSAESGRGLYLVDSLSARREYDRREGISVAIVIREPEDR